MIVFEIAFMLIGAMFLVFGYFIYFKKQYSLINNFEEDRARGLADDAYARRVGLTELISGAMIVIAGILSMFIGGSFVWISFAVCIAGALVSLSTAKVARSKREPKEKKEKKRVKN